MSELPIVVGIGASAGGLEALQEFFENMPADSGLAFVVVQHLSPDFKSLMGEILVRFTDMEIVRVDDRAPIEANRIYLIPARHDIRLDGIALRVDPQSKKRNVQHPINVFFQSLAQSCQGRCMAVILSGTGTDGAIGVRAVKDSGGMVLVQDPETARFDGMPVATIATGAADYKLSPPEMAIQILRLAGQLEGSKRGFAKSLADTTEAEEEGYEELLSIIESETGLSFGGYKPGTVRRRIARRMAIHQLESIAEYVDRVRTQAEECEALARDCLINVTQFFRDPAAFHALEAVLENKLSTLPSGQDFRAWVVGCSTGEEAYSIAILVDLILARLKLSTKYKIFATDLDDDAIERASAGRFVRESMHGLEEFDAAKFFSNDGDSIVISPAIRNNMIFAKHDLLQDPPFPKAHLVVCRNLLIYLRSEAQLSALERINFSLLTEGVLFLGPSETIDPLGADYRTFDGRWRIFEKLLHRQSAFSQLGTMSAKVTHPVRSKRRKDPASNELVRACEGLVGLFATSGVIATDLGEIIYSFGDTGSLLRVPPGMITTNVFELLPPELSAPARVALRQSRESGEPVKIEGLTDSGEGEKYQCSLLYLANEPGSGGLSIILIGQEDDSEQEKIQALPSLDLDDASRMHVQALETELQTTRESLQTTIEELETTNEEMQSVNEELVLSNEELQSTNEELHSVNEELYTVNAEHQSKIDELAEVSESLENLLSSTRIGMVFIDSDLCVRKFTPDARVGLPLRDSDVGRNLSELSNYFSQDVVAIVREVLRSGEPREERLRTIHGISVLLAVRPHQFEDGQGCVITIVDLMRMEAAQGDDQAEMLGLALTSLREEAVWAQDLDSAEIVYLSPNWATVWGLSRDLCLRGLSAWTEPVHPDDRDELQRSWALASEGHETQVALRLVGSDGISRWFEQRVRLAPELVNGRRLAIGLVIALDSRPTVASGDAGAPALTLSTEGNILACNEVARRALGENDSQQLAASFAGYLPSPESAQDFNKALHDLVEGATSPTRLSVPLRLEGGTEMVNLRLDLLRHQEAPPNILVGW